MTKDCYSLYIHIPFCENICNYCDFTKLQYFTNFATSYIKELKKELESYKITKPLKTIYVGGGTPTSLEDNLFLELLEMIKPYAEGVLEYTFEANPESLSINKLKMMKEFGVNRLSIGVESTNDEILTFLNRKHCFNNVKDVMKKAREISFDNINVDLILGLPHVSKDLLDKDIANLIALNPDHISCYSLTIHPHTLFYIKGYKEIDSDVERELYDLVNEKLEKAGFIHYEVSNWAKKHHESKHNFTYWKNEQYYGIGLGASGYINNVRYVNTSNLDKYLKGSYRQEEEIVVLKEKQEYQIMLNLRTNKGIDLLNFEKEFGVNLLESKKEEIEILIKQNYLYVEHNCLIPTYEGMMILDQIILKLID